MNEDKNRAATALAYAFVTYRDAESFYGCTPEESKSRWADVIAYPAIEAALNYMKHESNPSMVNKK